MANVVIVGGSEETRLLLRGLLRLYRHRVVGEGPSFRLPPPESPIDGRPSVALLDGELDDPELLRTLTSVRAVQPPLRIVLLTPRRTPQIEGLAREHGVDALLRRPFAVHELMEALNSALPATARQG